MYKMNSSVVCFLDCSCAVVPLKSCIVCLDDKPEDCFTRYGFRCGCKDKEKYMCDDCVSGWVKCGVNKSCPNCRHKNFAYLIRNALFNAEFSFTCDLPVFTFDSSFNELSYAQRQLNLKSHYLECFNAFTRKNVEFYDAVYSVMDNSQITNYLQIFKNIYDFIDANILSSIYEGLDEKEKFSKFFILTDEVGYNESDANKLMMWDFMNNNDFDYHFTSNTYWIYINRRNNEWDAYRFNFDTRDAIEELVEEDIINNIAYHDADDVIRFLNRDVRDAFNSNSHFWVVARENEMCDEINALINRGEYMDYLIETMRYASYVYTNPDDGYFECLRFEDPNNLFDDDGMDDAYFICEYHETHNL